MNFFYSKFYFPVFDVRLRTMGYKSEQPGFYLDLNLYD